MGAVEHLVVLCVGFSAFVFGLCVGYTRASKTVRNRMWIKPHTVDNQRYPYNVLVHEGAEHASYHRAGV